MHDSSEFGSSTRCAWPRCWMIPLPLLLLLMTSCGPRASRQPVIVVERSQVKRLPNGAYQVTQGWMVHRMQAQLALQAALDRCERKGSSDK